MSTIHGVLPVISTPFAEHDRIDEQTLAGEIDMLFDCGVDGVTIAMVSEVLRLTDAERADLARLTVIAAAHRGPVVVSVGAESTRAALAHVTAALDAGASALMAIPPIAAAVSDEALDGYFDAIIQASSVPVVIQDASGYVGRPLSLSMCASLLDRHGPDKVLFKPEAIPIGPRFDALQRQCGGRALAFEGTGGLHLVEAHARGVIGTMPGAEVPWAIVALWRALAAGDLAQARRIQGPLAALLALQTRLDDFVAVEKHLLVRGGVFPSARRRGPHADDLDDATVREVDALADLLAEVCGR